MELHRVWVVTGPNIGGGREREEREERERVHV